VLRGFLQGLTSMKTNLNQQPYPGHPGYQKTIAAVKSQYYWSGMKKEVVDFISRCLKCKKVKFEHRHPIGFLQPLPIPKWKWEFVTMDFIFPEQTSNMILSW
jgi:hypothetical protein